METKAQRTFLNLLPGERLAVLGSFLYFFFLLAAYYVLRPVRDEMGIQGGVKNLPWMFTATFLGMLALTPVFGAAASRIPRSKLVVGSYLIIVLNLALFYLAMRGRWSPAWTAKVFFVWLSVINYFIVSVFWSFMSDLYESEQAKRLFPIIAAGGSLGAIAGPAITASMVHRAGIPALFLISACLFGGAAACALALSRWAAKNARGDRREGPAVGGETLAGLRLILTNRYLLAIAGYILMLQLLGTFFYLEQARILAGIADSAARTRVLAQIDLAVNVATLLLQVFVAGRLFLAFGLATCLVLLPIFGGAGLLAVGLWPAVPVIMLASIVRRAAEFAISKPARETLYTVVTREERYKAKNVLDTLVSRGGDVASGWAHGGLLSLGASTAQVAFASIPAAAIMVALGLYLAGRSNPHPRVGETE